VREVPVGAEGIRLGQLLKLADVVDTGGAARSLLADGRVRVNGAAETRRGAQLRPGDVVEVADQALTLVAAAGSAGG
jgi:ribosome-associated protein